MLERAFSSYFLSVRLRSHVPLPASPPTLAIVATSNHETRAGTTFRAFALALAAFLALPPLALAAFVIAVDPYYVFGSPNWRGFNDVRPYYEPHVLVAKPYQVRRQQPSAVALGSSRVEVGIDPRHGGWTDTNVFNFALPSSNSYAVMLAFLHAQKVGAPLKQAVVGLDFFAYNINFPLASDSSEQRFADGIAGEFATFLEGILATRQKPQRVAPSAPVSTAPETWNEALYLAVNQDVAAAIARQEFKSGREHWDLAGRAERRAGATVQADWDESGYLSINPDVSVEVSRGTFVSGYHHYLAAGRVEGRLGGFPTSDWNEALYLAVNPDVKAAIARKEFKSGREHWELAGRAEHRLGSSIPTEWDEAGYLQVHPDVANAVSRRDFFSGYHHYLAAGRAEHRLGGFQPADWNEAGYLAANPDVRIRSSLGTYRNGYLHYVATGRSPWRLAGFPTTNAMEELRLRWPPLNQAIFQLDELFRLVFSATAIHDAVATIFRQSEPADFDGAGMRVWHTQEVVMRKLGGIGPSLRGRLTNGRWRPWMTPPKFSYCFTNSETGMTLFDPFRFMLRRAYAEGTDLRLYMTPLHAAVRKLVGAIGLDQRYEFWLKEIVRINEEEAARAKRPAFALWDFSAPSTITSEPIPAAGDLTPMRWYWDHSHYHRAAGDLILDRIFGYNEPTRHLPDDFGVQLTGKNIDAHLASSKAKLADWTTANTELASQITNAAQDLRENCQAEATCW